MERYRKIEDEFVSAAKDRNIPPDSHASEELLDAVIRSNPDLTMMDKINIKLYFNIGYTLDGLTEWVETMQTRDR